MSEVRIKDLSKELQAIALERMRNDTSFIEYRRNKNNTDLPNTFLTHAFNWDTTPEGGEYWYNVAARRTYENYEKKKLVIKLKFKI